MITKLLHLSDLHFGPPLRRYLTEVLIREAHQLSPDVVVVSGDLTQRASEHQFLQARAFLDRLPSPLLVIPGNHDVPLYNLFLRFRHPLRRYRSFIAAKPDMAMKGEVENLCLVGLNSTRSFTIDGGRLRAGQLDWAEAQFARSPQGACRIVAVHHHFLHDGGHQRPIRAAQYLLRRFADMGVEVALVGHRHWARAERATHGPVVVQAGTATSNRGKGEEKGKNSYNVIEVDSSTIRVTCCRYRAEAERFEPLWTKEFRRPARQNYSRGDQ